MTSIRRPPRPALRPFVALVWYSEAASAAERERVLPTGAMHVVVRLTGEPLRLFDTVDAAGGRDVSCTVVGGARAGHYVRDVSQPTRSVGAQLYPGVSLPLLGVPAEALAERHTPLEDLWGRGAGELREQILEAGSPEAALAMFETALECRLPRVRGVHPAVAHALARFATTADVGGVVDELGYSHRRFVTVFREAVGLTPKRYCRVLRFQRVLEALEADPARPWGELAHAAGYADQAHFNHEFRELAGLTPGRFRAAAPDSSHHVPVQILPRRPRPRGAR